MRINYDFTDLQAFLAVMETGSFHGAADQIGLSQPAVTRRIMKLEEMLETQLFQRHTRQVSPTLAGKRLKARAEAMLADAEEMTLAMRDETSRFAFQRNQIVTIATIPTVVSGLLAPALRKVHKDGQALRVRILDHSANGVAEAVVSGEADFGICSIPALDPGTDFHPLFDDPMVATFPEDHPLSAQDTVSWEDLMQEAVILPRQGTGNRLLIDEAMAAARVSCRWSFEVGRSTTAIDLVEAGCGIALLPRSSVVGRGRTRSVPLCAPEIRRPVGLLTRRGVRHSETSKALFDAVADAARSQFVSME